MTTGGTSEASQAGGARLLHARFHEWLHAVVHHRRHRHGHHHGPNRGDDARDTTAEGIRAVKVSLVGLGFTAALQAAVVVVTGSVALLGDSLHNLADALTAVPVWIAFVVGRRPANHRYTYGYGRAEDVAGICIIAVIAVSAFASGWQAISRLVDPQAVRNLGLLAVAAAVGFVGNELVARYRIRAGRAIGSAALVADGLHARADGFTSLAVLAGAIGVGVGLERADAIAGLVITAAILHVLVAAGRDVFHRLMDAVDPEVPRRARATLAAVPGVAGVTSVRIRWVGHNLRAEAEIVVDCELGLVQAHDIAVSAHHQLLHDQAHLHSALIHVDPCGHDGGDHHRNLAHHAAASGTAQTTAGH